MSGNTDKDEAIITAGDSKKWLATLKHHYESSSDETKREIIDVIITASSLQQLSYVKEKIEDLSYRDFLSLIPKELQDYLLMFLDPTTLLQCCQVSQNWNLIVNGSRKAWHKACVQLDLQLNIEAFSKPSKYWKNLYLYYSKLFRDMVQGRAFESVSHNGYSTRITALYYWNGKIATGSDNQTVQVWDCKLKDWEVSISTNCSISCIKFDDETLLISSYNGCLKSFSLSSGEMLKMFTNHLGAVFSLDFNKNFNLLVSGSADRKICLWSIQGGALLKTLHQHSHWVVAVTLIKDVKRLEGLLLLSMDKNEIRVWPITPKDGYRDVICAHCIAIGIPNFNFFTPGLHSDGNNIYFVKQDPRNDGYTLLCCWNMNEKKLVREQELDIAVKMLVAVGQKYACFIAPWVDSEIANFFVYRIKDLQVIAKWHIPPSSPTTPNNSQVCIGDTDWLNGLKRGNHTGVIMATGINCEMLYILKWNDKSELMDENV